MNYPQKNYIASYIISCLVVGALTTLTPFAFAQEATSTDDGSETATTTDEVENTEEELEEESVEDAQRRLQEVRNNVVEQRDRLLSPLRRNEAAENAQERNEIVRTKIQEASTTRDEIREERQEEKQQKRLEKQEERESRLEARAEARVRAYGERLERRYNAAIERLEKIAERIESRIEKLNERGVDTTDTERELQEAYGAITAAEAQVNAATDSLANIFISETPRDALQESKELFQGAKETIRDAHGALVESIALLKSSIENRTDSEAEEE